LRHRAPLRVGWVLHDRDAAALLDPGEAGRAVVVRARQDDADRGRAVGVGHRLEEDVDRRPRLLDALRERQGEPARLDKQVVVGGSQVNAAALDRQLVLRLQHRSRDSPRQELGKRFGRGFRMPVLCDDDRDVDAIGKIGEDVPHGAQAAPRGADADQLVRAVGGPHRTFLYSFSPASNSS
jgi:hypothetical protein